MQLQNNSARQPDATRKTKASQTTLLLEIFPTGIDTDYGTCYRPHCHSAAEILLQLSRKSHNQDVATLTRCIHPHLSALQPFVLAIGRSGGNEFCGNFFRDILVLVFCV